MKKRIRESRKKKEPKGLKLLFAEVKEILRLTGKSGQFSMLCVLAMILFVVGVMAALTMDNVMMVPVLAAGQGIFQVVIILTGNDGIHPFMEHRIIHAAFQPRQSLRRVGIDQLCLHEKAAEHL